MREVRHEDVCKPFGDVFGDLIIETPPADEAALRPYAISNGTTYEPINSCPFCGWQLVRRERTSHMGYEEVARD